MFSPSQTKTAARRDTASPSDLQALLADLNGSMDSSLNDTAESIGQPNRAKVCHNDDFYTRSGQTSFAVQTPAKSCMKSGKKRSISRVAFGSPTAAHYHIDSPSVSYTPMPKNAARASFSMEQGGETPSDEATASNSCILQAWETAAAEQGTSIAPSSAASRRSAKRRSSGVFKASADTQDAPTAVPGAAAQVVDASSPESLTGDGTVPAAAEQEDESADEAELAEEDDSFLSSDDEGAPSTRDAAEQGLGEEEQGSFLDAADDEEEADDMDTRMSLDPTEAANLLLKGRRSSMAPSARRRSSIAPTGGVKRPAEGPLAEAAPAPDSAKSTLSKRSRRSSVGGGLSVRSPRVLSHARDSMGSVATPDMAALLSDPLLAQGEDEITFAGTPAHKLSAKQLRRAAALSSASKAPEGSRRSSLGGWGDGDATEDLGSLVDLLQETGSLAGTAASAGSKRSRRSAVAGGDADDEDDMDTRMSLDPAAAAKVAAEMAAAASPAAVSDADGALADEEDEEDGGSDATEDEEGAYSDEHAPSDDEGVSDGDETFDAARAEEEALLMEAGITPTHRPASRGARTSADRISVAASVRAEHARAGDDAASPVVAQGDSSPLAPPTALTFDSEDDAETSPRRKSVSPATSLARSAASRRSSAAAAGGAPSPAGTAASSTESPAASGEGPSAGESVSPAAAPSPQRAGWMAPLRAPGILPTATVFAALSLPAEASPVAAVQPGAIEALISGEDCPVHWALTTASAQQAAGVVGVGVPSVAAAAADTVQKLLTTVEGSAAGNAASQAAEAALASIAARVLLPHARAMQWATGELQKQIAVSTGEIQGKMAEMSARNPAVFRQFKAAAVRGGQEAASARLGMQGLYLQQGATAAVRFQDWKLKMTSALAAAFEKGLKQANAAAGQLGSLTDKCAAAAHEVTVHSQLQLQEAADAQYVASNKEAVDQMHAKAAGVSEQLQQVEAERAAAAERVAALKQQVASMSAQVDTEEREAADADAAAEAVDDVSPEQALAATGVARAQLECAVALSGWALADASTAAGDTVLRSVVHTAVGEVRVPLGTVSVRCPGTGAGAAAAGAGAGAGGATVEFVAAPASMEPRTQAQREALALASHLVHDALAFSVGRAAGGGGLQALLAAVARGATAGAAAACDLIQLSLAHKVEVQRGSPLPRCMAAGSAVAAAQASSVSVTLTHRQQRGKVVLHMQLQHGQQGGSAAAKWRIGGSGAAKAALEAAGSAAATGGAGWMTRHVHAVDAMDFAA